jgi:beta-glucosidase
MARPRHTTHIRGIMHRRDFLASATLSALGAPPALTQPAPPATPHAAAGDAPDFPADFWWGSASAAYQIEGAAAVDGRLPSIWDTFSRRPGAVANGHTGDVAIDHYHRWREDIALMRELGVRHYRLSVAWPRVVPTGRGATNRAGLDFYSRLVDGLLAAGITPHVTLYHWDLPQALQDRYRGWESREVVGDFGDYATVVARALGDRVTHWMTLNEILTFTQVGYGVGAPAPHAPGLALPRAKARWQVVHHALLAHGTGCQAIRAASPRPCRVTLAENYTPFVPVIETPEHIAAAARAFRSGGANGAILTPILTGAYDPAWLAAQGAEAPDVRDGDLPTIHQPLDGLGFNCYTGTYVRAADTPAGYVEVPLWERYPAMGSPWLKHVPESIYWGIRLLHETFGRRDLPVFVSENGCADSGPTGPDAEVQDVDRVMYLRSYLGQVARARREGYPVVGYFPWSLFDNFEWADGYDRRFGMIYVDYPTQRRIPKLSYRWFREVVRTGRVV